MIKNLPNEISDYDFWNKLAQLSFVKKIILYGSRARSSNQERSDIDIALELEEHSNKRWQEAENIIEKADTLLKIDLVNLNKLADSEILKHEILNNGIIIYEKGK